MPKLLVPNIDFPSPGYDFESHSRQLQAADPTIGKAAVYLINNMDYDRFQNNAEVGKVIKKNSRTSFSLRGVSF